MYEVICADVLEWAEGYGGEKFHAMLCDPPYHLTSITERFGKKNSAPAKYGDDGAFQRASAGFMGQVWDGGDVSFRSETWEALKQHLYSGAFIMAFGGSRTYHKLATAIEEAGFILHPMIGWLNAQSFPKSTKIERSFSNGNSSFCQCVDSQQQSQQRGPQCNVSDEKNTISDSQSDYPECPHSDDEQLPQGRDNGQGILPLQVDAQEHIHSSEPLTDTQVGISPSCNPSQAQCTDRQRVDTFQGGQELSGDVSQSQQGLASEKRLACDSLQPNTSLNKTDGDLPSIYGDDDRSECHKLHTDNSDNALPSGSLDSPFSQSSVHSTTGEKICQVCGKVKKGIWEGHRYGLQTLKNSLEPLVVAQKPYEGRPVDCITGTGAGGLWIEGGRIGTNDELHAGNGVLWSHLRDGKTSEAMPSPVSNTGRWPANLILSHTPQCIRVGTRKVKSESKATAGGRRKGGMAYGEYVGYEEPQEIGYADENGLEEIPAWQCIPECPVRRLDEEVGQTSITGKRSQRSREATVKNTQWLPNNHRSQEYPNSRGGPSRFFFNADWSYEVAEQIAQADVVKYCPKAGRKERDAGLDQLPMQMRHRVNPGGLEHEERWAPVEMRNPHPTVKPIKLLKYLATILLPPPAYAPRRILIPFAGSGSEMIGAILTGWEQVIGIELSPDYCAIAEARAAHWSAQPQQKKLL